MFRYAKMYMFVVSTNLDYMLTHTYYQIQTQCLFSFLCLGFNLSSVCDSNEHCQINTYYHLREVVHNYFTLHCKSPFKILYPFSLFLFTVQSMTQMKMHNNINIFTANFHLASPFLCLSSWAFNSTKSNSVIILCPDTFSSA